MKIFVIYSQEVCDYSNDSIDFVCAFTSEKSARKKLALIVDEAKEALDFTKDYWLSEAIDLTED